MTAAALRILLVLLGAIALLILIEWYSAVRLRNDLDRADAEQHWASQDYEKNKPETP